MKNLDNFKLNDEYEKILIIFACNTMHSNLNEYLCTNTIDPRMKFYKLPDSIKYLIDKNNSNFTRKIYFTGTKDSYNMYRSELLRCNLVLYEESGIMDLIIKVKKYENITNDTLSIFDNIDEDSILILGCTELSCIGQLIL